MNFEENPGLLIKRLSHAMDVEMGRRLRAHGLTESQWRILMVLWKGEGRSQTELQERLGLERATITGLLQRMTAQGWVLRRSDPHDKRVLRVYLTDRSRELAPIAARLVDQITTQVLEGFSADERQFLHRLLLRALQNMEGQ